MKSFKNYFILKTLTSIEAKIKNTISSLNLHNFPKLQDIPTLSVFENSRQLISLTGLKSVKSVKKHKKINLSNEINFLQLSSLTRFSILLKIYFSFDRFV